MFFTNLTGEMFINKLLLKSEYDFSITINELGIQAIFHKKDCEQS